MDLSNIDNVSEIYSFGSTSVRYNRRKRKLSENAYEYPKVEEYFNKKFTFQYDASWHLPKLETVYHQERWNVDKFQEMKDELNNVKEKLSEFNLAEWSQYTKTRDPAGFVFVRLKKHVKPELLTQAWCKFYECLNQFPVICEEAITKRKLNSLHLCEAPGAFISALNHYISLNHHGLQWKWIANSLNPEYEGNDLDQMIPDRRLMTHTLSHWNFGLDKTGDITQFYNYQYITEDIETDDEILLITADGSINCMSNPGDQELLVEHLHFCETVTALTLLSNGGTFVIKMFTMFENSTICLLYLLNCCFSSVQVFKPCTSKSGNSEVYIICLEYKGKHVFSPYLDLFLNNYKKPNPNMSMFPKESIPSSFISQIDNCSKLFMSKQIKTINDNIYYFKRAAPSEYQRLKDIKNAIAELFLIKYNVKPIDDSRRIMPYYTKDTDIFNFNPELNNISTNLILFGTETNVEDELKLEFEIGKKINSVLYSEFCDADLLKKFCDANVKIHSSDFIGLLKELNVADINCSLHIIYSNDSLYTTKLFHDLHKVFNHIEINNNLVLIGCVFLTRFEASLLYLIMSCFSSVQYFLSGIIILRNSTEKIENIRNLFCEIKCKFSSTNEITSFETFILNVLPISLLRYKSFYNSLMTYNNSTLQYYLSECTENVCE